MTRFFQIGAFCLLLATTAWAQEVTFNATVSTDKVALGEQFQVTFTLSGGSLKQYRDFRVPDVNANFLTLMGPSSSQSMQIINGRVSTSISWTYVLQPRNVGTYSIGSATINYDGETLKTGPIKITVTTGTPGSSSNQAKKKEQDAPSVDLGDNFYMRAIVDKRTAYIGEPVTVTYKIYSRVAFQPDGQIKLPRMVGFWSEDIETPTQLKSVIEVINGKQYETYVVRKVVYFPTQSGELFIEPFELDCTVQVRQKRRSGDDFFDRFFSDPFFDSYKNIKRTLSTDRIALKILPLPEEGKPYTFNGAVGSFTMQTTLDKKKLKANETATLKVVIRGEGNIKLLEEPFASFPNDVDHFDPKVDEEIIRNGGKITGVKSYEYLLVPRYPGEKEIPPVEFSYFDYERKRYVTLESESFVLSIEEADPQSIAAIPGQHAVNYLTQDIRPPRKIDAGNMPFESIGISPSIIVSMYVLPVLAFGIALLAKRRYDRIHGDVVGLRMRRATRTAERHLSHSKKFLEANDIDAYYLEIARALWGYAQNKLNLPTSETSVERVIEALQKRNVAEDTQTLVRAALDATEYARFSPTRASREEMTALYDKARSAIIFTEQALKG